MSPAAASIAAPALAALAWIWMICPARPTPEMRALLKGRKFAHRGLFDNKGDAPENSIRAFAAARNRGYAIELDIRLTADGELAVFHDESLARACGVAGRVEDLPMARVRELALFASGQRIPSLAQALSEIGGEVPVLVELKTGAPGATDVGPLCREAARALDAYDGAYLIESFDAEVLRWFRKHRPDAMRGQLALGYPTYEKALGKKGAAAIPALRRRMLSWLLFNYKSRPHFVSYRFEDAGLPLRLCRALGAMSAAWTVRTREDSDRLLSEYDAVIFEGFEA